GEPDSFNTPCAPCGAHARCSVIPDRRLSVEIRPSPGVFIIQRSRATLLTRQHSHSDMPTITIADTGQRYECAPDDTLTRAELPAYMPKPRRFQARLVAVRDLTHDIREFQFRGDAPAHFLPGQYLLFNLPGVPGARAYSMANVPDPSGEWHFQVKRVPGGHCTA